MSEQRTIKITTLSQYLRLGNCDRFLWLSVHPQEQKRLLSKWDLTIQPLTPLLREMGISFEEEVAKHLGRFGKLVRLNPKESAETTRQWLLNVQEPTILVQVPLEGMVNEYRLGGVADVVHLERDGDGALHVHISDIKASRQEKTDHRLQVAGYAQMLTQICEEEGLEIATMRGSVIHRTEDGGITPYDPKVGTFDLKPYLIVLQQLLYDPDSTVSQITKQDFDDVRYHLKYACDGCVFNAICMYDSAERLDLTLVPTITATEKRALKTAGISSVNDLAELMELLPDSSYVLRTTQGKEELVRKLNAQWPLSLRLPQLVQKARSIANRFDRSIKTTTYLISDDWGSLPDDGKYPDMVKVFFDAEFDYVASYIYMVSALVKGPKGSRVIIRHTRTIPTDDTEREILIEWVQEVLRALREVADDEKAPVHLYCYDPSDQRQLLDALKRHLNEVTQLPGFFDLITQHPAVTQSAISFLAKELRDRANLGLTCNSLHDAARHLGFDWRDDKYFYYALFQARMFDNRKDVVRGNNGRITPASMGTPKDAPGRVRLESASRFNSQIPLEYAYAAWNKLPDMPKERQILEPFRKVTWDHIRGFGRRRVEALAHIEDWFRSKNKMIEKPALDLGMLSHGGSPAPTLAQSLREFLFIEHYTATQAYLQNYSLPIERRLQTGQAMLLRHEFSVYGHQIHRFSVPFDIIYIDPALLMNNFRLKEGSWVVINDADSKSSAGSAVKHGLLGTIVKLGTDYLDISLTGLSFGTGTRFRFWHRTSAEFQPGNLYTLDEMADDLNADKMIAALQNSETNHFYEWLEQLPAERDLYPHEVDAQERAFRLISEAVHPTAFNSSQQETINRHLDKPLYLVQGPPGTGKSYTISWMALSRVLAAMELKRPLRIAVSSKTHNAVNIVLKSIAEKWAKLVSMGLAPALEVSDLPVYKLIANEEVEVPSGVIPLPYYSTSAQELEQIITLPIVVIGGTPGGLYSLARQRQLGGRGGVAWSGKPFDLLVMDEASQMNLPEAVLAGAFLRPDGQAIIVGDHRQMPPIIAHEWDKEELRSAAAAEPQLSLFESLIARGVPKVSLDESFRLHTALASFLQENVYFMDGIQFHSKKVELLTNVPVDDSFVKAVLDPNFPIVVVEHHEEASQQYNEFEYSLLAPILEAATTLLDLDGNDGMGVVVPHRAQRAMLQIRFPALAETGAIDTVERFQGGERDLIIVSATASDPDFVLSEAEFLLNLNRLNVAISRPRKKLIVIASRTVTSLLTSDLDTFEHSIIWKRLYYDYANEWLWKGIRDGHQVHVRGHRAESA